MSGVAAVLARLGQPPRADEVLAMLDAIPYRGLDGARAQQFGPALLGHTRQAATASDRAAIQPLRAPRSGCAIVSDTRIDNRDELRAQLGGCPVGISDAELILLAYERWELDAPSYLLGDFAFIIWDPRRRELVCARDGGGQRTLFYRADRRSFAAASEIHQLLQAPDVPLEPNEERIRAALLPISIGQNAKEQPATYYAGIQSLMPGHLVRVGGDRLEVRRFWELQPPRPIRYRRPEQYVEHFRSLFFQAVSARLQTDGPLGAALSGGLDSSSIVCAAQELYRAGSATDTGFSTLSVIYDGLDCDERELIGDVQARYGFDARYLSPNRSREWLQLEPDGFRSRPELPTSGMATLFDAAQDAGQRVLLTGEVSDSIVRGSPLVIDSLLRQGRFAAAWTHLSAYRAATGDSLLRSAALYGIAPLLPLGLQRRLMAAHTAHTQGREAWYLLPRWMPDPLRADLLQRNAELALGLEARRRFANETRHIQHLQLDPPEVPTMASGWALEIWRPFADRRLHEFVLAIPPEHLFEAVPDDPTLYGGSKQLLRRSMRGMLPESIRGKLRPTSFASTIEREIDRQWELHASVFGPGGRSQVAARGYVDAGRFWDRLQQARAGRLGPDLGHLRFVIGLETWLRGLAAPRLRASRVSSYVRVAPAVLVNDDETGSAWAPPQVAAGRGPLAQRSTLVLERR
ncbi:MAG: asparagine synthetase B [Chloroflexi bacterium]|nr:asparagine synthetase B [Chloroflexota bacterium]